MSDETTSAVRIQDDDTELCVSVLPIVGHPDINGVVVCNRDGSEI